MGASGLRDDSRRSCNLCICAASFKDASNASVVITVFIIINCFNYYILDTLGCSSTSTLAQTCPPISVSQCQTLNGHSFAASHHFCHRNSAGEDSRSLRGCFWPSFVRVALFAVQGLYFLLMNQLLACYHC